MKKLWNKFFDGGDWLLALFKFSLFVLILWVCVKSLGTSAALVSLALEKNVPLDEIYQKYDKNIVDETVRKIYRMQFKRHQCCLGVRLTEKAFFNGVNLPIVQKFY